MTLTSPAPGRPITSPYGWRRHPITQRRSLHHGIDYGGRFPVVSAGKGTVIANAFDARGLGYYVGIQHNPNLRTYYGHGETRSKLTVGASIRRGASVYPSGSTGESTGPHLHFEVRVRRLGIWVRVNPAPYLTTAQQPTAPPTEEEDPMKDSLLIWTRHRNGGMLWAHIPASLDRFVPIFKQKTADAIAARIGAATVEVAAGEWNGYRVAAGLQADPDVR